MLARTLRSTVEHRLFPAAFIALTALAYVLVVRELLTLELIFGHDGIYWHAIPHHVTEALRAGFLPLWNPYVHGGEPFFFLTAHLMLIGPLNLLVAALCLPFDVSSLFVNQLQTIVLQLFVASGVYLFYREISHGSRAALLAFPLFLFTGASFNAFHQNGILVAFNYLPYILFFFVRYCRDQRAVHVVGLGASVGFGAQSVYFGYQATVIALFAVAYGVLYRREITAGLSRRLLAKHIALLLFVLLPLVAPTIALVLYKAQIFPSARVLSGSGTENVIGITYESLRRGIGSQGSIEDLYFLFDLSAGRNETRIFVGVALTFVLLVGLCYGGRERPRERILFGSMSALGIVLFLGAVSDWYYPLFTVMPPLRIIRNTHFFANTYFFFLLYFVVTGAQTVARVLADPERGERGVPLRRLLPLPIGVVAVSVALMLLHVSVRPSDSSIKELNEALERAAGELGETRDYAAASLYGVLSGLSGGQSRVVETIAYWLWSNYRLASFALVATGIALMMWLRLVRDRDAKLGRRAWNAMRVAVALVVPLACVELGAYTLIMFYGRAGTREAILALRTPKDLPFAFDYRPFEPPGVLYRSLFASEQHLMRAARPGSVRPHPATSEINYLPLVLHARAVSDYYGVLPLSFEAARQPDGSQRRPTSIYTLESFANIFRGPLDDKEKARLLRIGLPSLSFDTDYTVVDGGVRSTRAGSGAAIAVERFLPHALALEVNVERAGLLVYSDAYTPEWNATLDGRDVPLLLVNGIYKGLRLAPGKHRVEMSYRPVAYLSAVAIYAAALLALTTFAAWRAAAALRASRARRRLPG